jgi:cobalamin biosynthesis protein CobD/CbiB
MENQQEETLGAKFIKYLFEEFYLIPIILFILFFFLKKDSMVSLFDLISMYSVLIVLYINRLEDKIKKVGEENKKNIEDMKWKIDEIYKRLK